MLWSNTRLSRVPAVVQRATTRFERPAKGPPAVECGTKAERTPICPPPPSTARPSAGATHRRCSGSSDTVRSVLEPDVVDLEYVFEPQGQRYRWRMTGNQVTPAPDRAHRDPAAAARRVLSAPFAVPGLVRGRPRARCAARAGPGRDPRRCGSRSSARCSPSSSSSRPRARSTPRPAGASRAPPMRRRRRSSSCVRPARSLRERGRRGARSRAAAPSRTSRPRAAARCRCTAGSQRLAASAARGHEAPRHARGRPRASRRRSRASPTRRRTSPSSRCALLSTLSLEDVRDAPRGARRLRPRGRGRRRRPRGPAQRRDRAPPLHHGMDRQGPPQARLLASSASPRAAASCARSTRVPASPSGRLAAGQTPAGGVPARRTLKM